MKKILFLVAGVVLLSGCEIIKTPVIKERDEKPQLRVNWPKPKLPSVAAPTAPVAEQQAPPKWFYKAVEEEQPKENIYLKKNEKQQPVVP